MKYSLVAALASAASAWPLSPFSSVRSPALHARATLTEYTNHAVAGIVAMQGWYVPEDGLYNQTGWWNSANCLQVLGDFALLNVGQANQLNIGGIMINTFNEAQQVSQIVSKKVEATSGMVRSSYTRVSRDSELFARQGYAGFINDYYDDEGWWALAWIRAYDVTQYAPYLEMAKSLYKDMQGGVDDTCGGGIWWSKARTYKNAIANELYIAVAASLANRPTSSDSERQGYITTAQQHWKWFKNSGMINAQNTINDGLKINDDGSCVNSNGTVFSYNQGVILGGLVELDRALGSGSDSSLLPAAAGIANAAMTALSTDGILHEPCEPSRNCGGDGRTFKGVFLRNLQYLYRAGVDAITSRNIRGFVGTNADTLWVKDRNPANNQFGLIWSGPYDAQGAPVPSTQSSAVDCLVAAMAIV